MVRLETASLKQKATLWPAGTESTSAGQKKVTAAVEIDVRWEDKEDDALDPKGEVIRIDATAIVKQDIEVGSLMWLGRKRDWSAGVTLSEVVSFSKIPTIKGGRFRRVAGLRRFSDTLPPIQT